MPRNILALLLALLAACQTAQAKPGRVQRVERRKPTLAPPDASGGPSWSDLLADCSVRLDHPGPFDVELCCRLLESCYWDPGSDAGPPRCVCP